MRELPPDTPMDEIERLVRIDRTLEEAKYSLAEKKFEEEKEKRAQEKAIQEVATGDKRTKSKNGKRSQAHRPANSR